MKRLLLIPAIAVGCLLWACDSNSPAEPEVSADQTELMNFVHTPTWPDLNEDGYFCVADDNPIINGKMLPNGTIHWFYPGCKDNQLFDPGTLLACKLTPQGLVCPGEPCPGDWVLVTLATGANHWDPANCNGGPPG